MVVWRIAEIFNKKDLSFWAGATKTGSALVTSVAPYSLKAFFRTANEKKWEVVHNFSTSVEMTHKTEFTTADFVILSVVKK